MRKLSALQKEALDVVTRHSGLTTHQLNTILKNRQSYESNLRDRLFNLASKGLVRYEEKRSENHAHWVIARRWFAV